MTKPTDQRLVEWAVEVLEGMAEAGDADTDLALNAARRRALETINRPLPSAWRWATATAAVLALAIGIAFLGGNGDEESLLAQQPVAEADLYQEMEFYLWLSEQLESE